MRTRNSPLWLLLMLVATPVILAAQPTDSCLSEALDEFLLEIDDKLPPNTARGNDFLVAYGWIKAAQVCIEFESYPDPNSDEVQFFESRITNTVDVLEDAIRTGSDARLILGQSAIIGDATGIDSTLYVFPKSVPGSDGPPSNRPSGILSQGIIAVPLGGGIVADSTPTRPPPATNTAGYRMLSMDEWRLVQRRLTRLGHDTGDADGILGPNTYAAIRSYQRANGMRPTGVLTSRHLDRLLR